MKKIRKVILICFAATLLCACSPASKEESTSYVKNEFGNAEYSRTEEIDDKTIRYYFVDEEYGFEYWVTSEVNDILIDGAKFGETESKSSNFEHVYYNYILTQVQKELLALEKEYRVQIATGFDEPYRLAEVYCEAGEESIAPEVTEVVKELFAAYDTRDYWFERCIEAYDAGENRLGSYSFKYDRFLTPEEEEDVLFYERIEMLSDEAEFVRKEQKVFKDTNISLQEVAIVLGSEPTTEDSIVTFYYFTVEGEEYFMADVLMNAEGSVAWYTNYEEE